MSVQPLNGIRVIDLTHALAGPYCTRQLALCGAEVIKIERPEGGDEFREFSPTTFVAANSGKRSVTLDLKSSEGREILDKLIAEADILVENLRPGSAAGLGLNWERLQSINSRLIFCSVSGFGQTGTFRDMPAIEWSVQAMSGLNAMYMGDIADPQRLGISILDPFAGYMAFTAILTAMLQRQHTGRGQRVDVAMFDAAWALCGPAVAEILRGETPLAMARRPTAARFMARDRRLFISLVHSKWFDVFCELTCSPELKTDSRFVTAQARSENGDALVVEIESRLAHQDAEHWEQEFTRRGVPASTIRTIAEVAETEHVRERELLQEVNAPDTGEALKIVGMGFRFEHDQPGNTLGPPMLGESTDRILSGLGYTQHDIDGLRARGVI